MVKGYDSRVEGCGRAAEILKDAGVGQGAAISRLDGSRRERLEN
jgi:hypothetical protein